MYSDIKNVQILLSLLKAYNISHIVLSPGNRNVPFVHSVENDSFFKCYSVVDERGAAFFALGLIQELKSPVAISCTSGTAASNYAPAINEAGFQKLPLVAITADRNPCYLNQLEDQMISQIGMYQNACKKSVHLPIVEDAKDFWYCKRLVSEALLELNHHGSGPVHINIPIEKGVTSFNTKELPIISPINRIMHTDEDNKWQLLIKELESAKKILIIYGQSLPVSEDEKDLIEKFIQKYNCAIAVDHLSNLKCKGTIETFTLSRVYSDEALNKLLPEIVITVNGNFVSYIKGWLKRNNGKFRHWSINEAGEVIDPFRSLTDILECTPSFFFRYFVEKNSNNPIKNDYYESWKSEIESFSMPDIIFSDLYAVQEFIKSIPGGSMLHLANGSSVRLAQHFALDENIAVYCNRGTNGIDGSLSTFIGQSSLSGRLSFLLIGDLSFFYDINALWNRHIGKNIRILLNNNGGAGLFHFNIGTNKISTLNLHIAAEHFSSVKQWAESMGFEYLFAKNKDEFDASLPLFMSGDSEKPILFEIFTQKEENAKILHDFYSMKKADNKFSSKKFIKGIIKKI